VICVDASVAAKWILEEPLSDQARALFRDASAAGERFCAPVLLPYEVTNIIRQRVGRQAMSLAEADAVMMQFLMFPLDLRHSLDSHARTLIIANRHAFSAAYDAHYVALAQEAGCDLWTDDQRLVRGLGDEFPYVRWIGDSE
jgi:predicted nucleic acid-binding protein